MTVLIKGIDMPGKGAERCIVICSDGTIRTFVGAIIEGSKATLVPTPHGRLIDADKIPFVQSENGCADDYAYRYDINELPTIIEAEE